MPVLVGFVGFGTDYALWVYTHQAAQAAAESAAVSAATAGNNFTLEGQAVAATYGFVDGSNSVTVTVNQPPQSGSHITTAGAVEVIVQRTQTPIFSAAIWKGNQVAISARAVALGGGAGCVLALDKTASGAITVQGSAQVALSSCNLNDNSNSGTALSLGGSGSLSALGVGVVGNVSGSSGITTTNGLTTGAAATRDPYASASFGSFSGCDQTNYTVKTTGPPASPGVYCGGISINAGATLTLSPGIYYLDQGSLSMAGNSTITGTGVTLVFTSSTGKNWATADIGGNATVNLTAPTSGPTAGIVLFGDPNMDVGTTFRLGGGGSQTFGGAVYLPKAALTYSGGASSNGCTQIIADTITFTGNSSLAINCSGYGTKFIGTATASLVE
jgi:Putative Flp pilus-assembly TadE/G-like